MKKKSFCSILPAQWAVIAMLILFSVISIALAAVPALGAPIQCRLTAENYAVEVDEEVYFDLMFAFQFQIQIPKSHELHQHLQKCY